MDKCRSRPRRPDKALYVPKARRNTDEPPSGGDPCSEHPPAFVSESPVQKRHTNTKADSRVYEHGKQGSKNAKSPVLKKNSQHKNDKELICTQTGTTENDYLCEGVNNLVLNEETSPGSVQNDVPTSHTVPSAAAHAGFFSKEEEQLDVQSRSASQSLGEQHENMTQGSIESLVERDRMTVKAQDQGMCQSRKTSSLDVSIEDPKRSKHIAVSASTIDQVAGGPVFTCQQEVIDLPARTILHGCEHKAHNIDNTTNQQKSVLFHSTDCTEIITTSEIVRDPLGQLATVCSSDADNEANVLLYEKPESIEGRKLDSIPAIAEDVSELAEGDNSAIVCAIEPSIRAADEHIADLKACLSVNEGGLHGIHNSKLSGNSSAAHIRVQNPSENARKVEAECENSPSSFSHAHIQQEGRRHITEGSRDLFDNPVLDQFVDILPAVVTAEQNQSAANVESLPCVASMEEEEPSRTEPNLDSEQMPLAAVEQVSPSETVELLVSSPEIVGSAESSDSHAEQATFEEHVPSVSEATEGDEDSMTKTLQLELN
ncbi:PREDICTED: coiled-coil domain-containing protein R3HCC1L-like [Nanorana parkeri]|uniref:coiled-coil domain-containing protein R3HCC1L-like n=1 Tax=Nanorana parkeri TaxID=125878 RepID=UPI000854A4A3|nr:PREDICTED: coiled-coil domain-containing protein R3HCC1L-like [Nanorana parkeri]